MNNSQGVNKNSLGEWNFKKNMGNNEIFLIGVQVRRFFLTFLLLIFFFFFWGWGGFHAKYTLSNEDRSYFTPQPLYCLSL